MMRWRLRSVVAALALAGCGRPSPDTAGVAASASSWCGEIPRPANGAYPKVPGASDWFDVYDVGDGVYALVEPRQFQEAISYLIVGETRALLFDTGLGMVPIRPVVERLTTLPIEVFNSHTHYDHVGGNAEFDRILAFDTPYTRVNQAGFEHAELAGEVARESFCGEAGRQVDTAGFRTRPWRPARVVADGDTIDLGGRVLTIHQVPGHTPDAAALLDATRGLLFTGDSYYDATIWLYVPETDLDAYDSSMTRLAGLPGVVRLLPAHNTVQAEPRRLGEAVAALRGVRAGSVKGEAQSGGRVVFRFDRFSILTSTPLLEGRRGDQTRGGSGLTVWK